MQTSILALLVLAASVSAQTGTPTIPAEDALQTHYGQCRPQLIIPNLMVQFPNCYAS